MEGTHQTVKKNVLLPHGPLNSQPQTPHRLPLLDPCAPAATQLQQLLGKHNEVMGLKTQDHVFPVCGYC